MTMADEYGDKIENLIKQGKVDEANKLISSLEDEGIILWEPEDDCPYIDLEWKIDIAYAGEPTDDIYWNADVDEDDVEELADDICGKEGIPYGRILDVRLDEGHVFIRLYECDNDGVPTGSKAYNDWAEINVKGEEVKNLIVPAPKDDETVTIGYFTEASMIEDYIRFSDGSDAYIDVPNIG